jgi:formylglycine-generating enzyme
MWAVCSLRNNGRPAADVDNLMRKGFRVSPKCGSVLCIVVLVSGVLGQITRGGPSTANMALIPGATYEMGTDAAAIPRLMEKFNVRRAEMFDEETPKHPVTVPSFYLDRTEVTNVQFRRFIERNPEWQKDRIPAAYHNGKYLQQWNGTNYPVGRDNYPVVYVTWYAAAAFCREQGKRLPTEAEWEYAARGGLEGKDFPWGNGLPDKTRANFGKSGANGAVAVASYQANGYGLHDMSGNVWEYLADEWGKYPTSEQNTQALKLFDDRSFLAVKTRRALRGGSYGGGVVNLRVTYRDSHSPENAGDHVGFRCAMTAPVQSSDVNELLRLHYRDRAAHFERDATYIFSQFADDSFSVGNGKVNRSDRAAGQKGLQAYFDSSTFLEWDDITPPIIRVSDDGSMAYSHVQKKVRRLARDQNSGAEEISVFAWTMTFRKISGKWKVTSVTSTNAPGTGN